MKECEKCRYLLVRDRCPICGGKQIKGVGPVEKPTHVLSINNIAEPLQLYWSPTP